MRPIRLVIADRRPIVLQGFATLFAAESDFSIVASCLDGASCLKAVRTLRPDLVLVEDGFLDVTASDMLAVVKAENISTRLVFYTASVAHGDLAAAIAAGACCAISMNEEPEALMQSLRLVAPTPDRATGGNGQNGALAALTDQERKIMRLVAYGMSNKQIARQLKVSTGTIKARLDRISEQLGIESRTEIAAFALSRLYGGIGALAALLYAALDDIQPAEAAAFGHGPPDTITMTAADGTAQLITIKINAKKTAAASGKTDKSVFKGGRAENPIDETPGRAGKLIQSSNEIASGSITPPTISSPRPTLVSYGTLMIAAAAAWICDLLNSVAQAANLGDSPTVLASATESRTGELAAPHSPGSGDANHDNLAWFYPETYHQAFAFDAPGSDTIVRNGDALQIIGADADEDGVSSNSSPHVGSGSIDVPIDHGRVEQAAATDTSGNTPHDGMKATVEDESSPGQSQRDLHAAEDGGAAAKQHGNHGSGEDDSPHGQSQHEPKDSTDGSVVATKHSKHESNHGQTQRDSHASEADPAAAEDGGAAAKQHGKHGSAKDDSSHGQSQHELKDSTDGSVVAEKHSKHEPQGSESNHGQTQRDSHASEASPAAAKHDAKPASGANSGQSHREHDASHGNPHADLSQHAGAKDQTHASTQAHQAAAPELGDSFHFKTDIAASQASHISDAHGGHAPDFIEHGPHTAGHDGLPPVQDSDLIGPSGVEQSALHHAQGAEHHLTHDLLV